MKHRLLRAERLLSGPFSYRLEVEHHLLRIRWRRTYLTKGGAFPAWRDATRACEVTNLRLLEDLDMLLLEAQYAGTIQPQDLPRARPALLGKLRRTTLWINLRHWHWGEVAVLGFSLLILAVCFYVHFKETL